MPRQDTRKHIIDTASDLFYQKAYNLVGINEIIAEAGIAKATLYSHFRSKEELCLAYLDQKDGELIIGLTQYLGSKRKGKSRLIAILEFLLDFFKRKDFRGCWCIRTNAEMANNQEIKNQIKSNKKRLQELIAEEVLLNLVQLSTAKAKELSTTIYMLYEAGVMESFLQEEAWPIEHCIKILKTTLKEI